MFPRFKADPIQQPKRTNNSRKKWPNMKYLGSGTLELGPHKFSNTTFYEVKRSIPWKTIANEHGLNIMTEETDTLEFSNVVFELSEIPNERFIFPKEALVSLSAEKGSVEVNPHPSNYTYYHSTHNNDPTILAAFVIYLAFGYNRWVLLNTNGTIDTMG